MLLAFCPVRAWLFFTFLPTALPFLRESRLAEGSSSHISLCVHCAVWFLYLHRCTTQPNLRFEGGAAVTCKIFKMCEITAKILRKCAQSSNILV